MGDSKLQQDQKSEKAQQERIERAISALSSGLFQVTRIGPQKWTVKTGTKLPYAVSLEEDTWNCTCLDFLQRGPQIFCKHIEGVRLLETAQNKLMQPNHKENHMEQPQFIPESNLSTRVDHILWELRQPLDMSRVKRRQAPGMGSVPYLEGYDVIDRANAIFGFAWTFELLNDPVIVRWQKKILIWNQQEKRKVPQVDTNGVVQAEEVGIVYITGKVTIDLGDKHYSHADLGRCIFTGDTPEALDMALAGSATDCLKRCFRQCGHQFGNDLYDKEIAQNAGLDQGRVNGHGSSFPPQSTAKSPTFTPLSSTPIARKYSDGTSVNGNVSEQEAFDSYKKTVGTTPASKEALRTWMSGKGTPAPFVAA